MQTTHKIFGYHYIGEDALSCGDYGGAGSVGVANIRDLLDHSTNIDGYVTECRFQDIDDSEFDYVPMSWEKDIRRPVDFFRYAMLSDTPPLIVKASGFPGAISLYILAIDTVDESLLPTVAVELLGELTETVNALADYPLISDETHSLVEMEWEQEAWDGWVKSDLIGTLSEGEDDGSADWQTIAESLSDAVLFTLYRDAMETTNTYPEPEHSCVHIDIDRISTDFYRLLIAHHSSKI